MSQQELLKRVVEVLDGARIAYMATGSIVSSVQGEPRSTHDIDLVVEIKRSDASALLHAFPPPDYYLDEGAITEAIGTGGMFNLLDVTGGDKVDFWMLKPDAFDQEAFARRYAEDIAGVRLFMSRPEDTILSKLRWADMCGGSEKQLHDVLRIYEVQHDRLDIQHIETWVDRLGVRTLWERVKSDAFTG
jgi:hypothetical protein